MRYSSFRFIGSSMLGIVAALLLLALCISPNAYADTGAATTPEQVIDKVLTSPLPADPAKSEDVASANLGTASIEDAAGEADKEKGQETGDSKDDASEANEAKPQGTWEWTSAGWKYLVSGAPAKSFITDEGKIYYLDPNTGIMKTGWVKVGDEWYYATGSGALRMGWLFWRGKWYYLDSAQDGKMLTGKYKVGSDWYISDGSGAMHENRWVLLSEGWYYATGSGALKTGWLYIGGHWYYLDPSADALMTTGKKGVGGATYYLDPSSGAMKTGWSLEGKDWYYYDGSGAMKTGWLKSGPWYYLDPKQDGKMLTGKYKVGSEWYISNASGAMHENRWVLLSEGWYYATGSGALKTGWLYIGGHWYYLDPAADALMVSSTCKTIDKELYSFVDSGAMRANCQIKLDDGKCGYATSSGAIATIGVFDGDKVILKDGNGKTLTGWQSFGGTKFFGDENGIPHTGWLDDGGKWYWFNADGAMAVNAWVDNGRYYVGSTGAWRPYGNDAASAKLLAAAGRVGYQGNGYCARWVDRVYMAAGYSHFDGDARDFYWKKCTISDLNLLEPGMVIAVPSHTHTALGRIYGHVAIYMGNGMVRENTSAVKDTPLSTWLAYYQTTYPAKCGWAF